jgi:hypothetical protein
MTSKMIIAAAIAVSLVSVSAWADNLPKEFLGHWKRAPESKTDDLFVGANIGPKTYYELGTNCDIIRVKSSRNDAGTDTPIFLVDMLCLADGLHPGRPQKGPRGLSLRYVNNEPVLIIAGASSINLLQRAE